MICFCGNRGAAIREYGAIVCDDCAAIAECHNNKFCLSSGPVWHLSRRGGFCLNCDIMFYKKSCYGQIFIFKQPDDEDPQCPVCMDTNNTLMRFPAPNCGHWLCVTCCRKIMHYDERWWCLDPCAFGCPPCPRGCSNPAMGVQCSCLEYEEIKTQWREKCPLEYQAWFEQEGCSIATGLGQPGSFYCSNTCPLCRRVV